MSISPFGDPLESLLGSPLSGGFPGLGLSSASGGGLLSPLSSASSLLSPFSQGLGSSSSGGGYGSQGLGILQLMLQMMGLLVSLMSGQSSGQGVSQYGGNQGLVPVGVSNFPYALVPTGQSSQQSYL